MNLKVECVWCNSPKDFNKFTRINKLSGDYNKKFTQIISYPDITDRLGRYDPYGVEPTETVVSIYIQKLIKALVRKHKNLTEIESDINTPAKVTYLIKDMNGGNIEGFKQFLSEISGGFTFDLVVIDKTEKIDPALLSKFDNVKFISNDKP